MQATSHFTVAGAKRTARSRRDVAVESTARATWRLADARSGRGQGRDSGPWPLSASARPFEIPASRFDPIPPGSPLTPQVSAPVVTTPVRSLPRELWPAVV